MTWLAKNSKRKSANIINYERPAPYTLPTCRYIHTYGSVHIYVHMYIWICNLYKSTYIHMYTQACTWEMNVGILIYVYVYKSANNAKDINKNWEIEKILFTLCKIKLYYISHMGSVAQRKRHIRKFCGKNIFNTRILTNIYITNKYAYLKISHT